MCACLPAALIARKLLTFLPYSLSLAQTNSLLHLLSLSFFPSSFRPSSQIVAHCMRLSFANFFSYFNWHFADSLAEYSTAIRYASHIAHPQKLTHIHTHVRTHTEPTPPQHILIQPPFPLLAPENEMKTFLPMETAAKCSRNHGKRRRIICSSYDQRNFANYSLV